MDTRIEKVARAMAVAEGLNPDEEMEGAPGDFLQPRIEGSGVATRAFGPRWQLFARAARMHIAAHDALAAN